MRNRIRDQSGAFLTPGSGMGKKSGSGSGIRIRNEQTRSHFRELRNNFLGKILKFCDADPGWEKFGTKMEKIRIRDPEFGINIPDPQHCKKD
jgi:hypothetical protein